MKRDKAARERGRGGGDDGRVSRRAVGPKGLSKGGKHLSKGSLLLRAWRLREGMTQWQATHYFGFGYERISSYELGYRRPSLPVAVQIRDRTGIPPETWMESAPAGKLPEEGNARRSSASVG